MCTVTFIPQTNGFILTHNRDEASSRSPKDIVLEKNQVGHSLVFPRDAQAGGTWFVTSDGGRTACLLNGAFVLHTRQLPYRRSRGLILLDLFDWSNPDAFFRDYDLERIEPFTLLFFEQKTAPSPHTRVLEFRWDGEKRYLRELSGEEPHFWCSATLYPAAMQEKREQVFVEWLTQFSTVQDISSTAISHLHRTGSVGDPANDYIMNRGGKVQTLSITQVLVDEKNAQMHYADLLEGNESKRRLVRRKRSD